MIGYLEMLSQLQIFLPFSIKIMSKILKKIPSMFGIKFVNLSCRLEWYIFGSVSWEGA